MAAPTDIGDTPQDERRLAPALVGFAALVASILILVLYSGSLLPFQMVGVTDISDDVPSGRIRMLMVGSYGLVFLLAGMHYRDIPYVAAMLVGIIVFFSVLFASFLWSANPPATFRATVSLSMTTLFAAAIYTHYGLDNTIRLLFFVLLGLIGLSTVLAVAVPGMAVHTLDHPGAWRGYFTHKNVAGQNSVWLLPAALYLMATGRLPRWGAVAGIVAALAFILMTQSKTSLSVAVLALGLYVMARLLRNDMRATAAILLFSATIVGVAAFLLAFAPEMLVALLGRDATFTGRTFIWSELTYIIQQKPVLGHGFRALWDVTYGPLYRFIEDWQINSGHNTFLDLLVDVGVVGTTIFVLLLLNQFRKALILICYGNWPVGLFGFLVMLMLTLLSFSESIMPRAHTLHWVMFVVAFLGLETHYRALRRSTTSQL